MNKFMRFAAAMSEELFTMKAEDYPSTTLYMIEDHTHEFVPPEYVTAILDDPAHIKAIKEQIRMSVLEDVTSNPDDYDMCGKDYVYSGNIYDHAALVDSYIEEQFLKDHPEFHTRHICSACGSDNVQVKAWVRPNQNNKYVGEADTDQPDFCDDCQQHVYLDTAEVNVRHKVIGYQVVSSINEDLIHPAMTNQNSVYSIMEADAMLRALNYKGSWKLMTIWTKDIANPVMMFEGDPRNPKQ